MTKLLSIIIPSYNMEKYLQKCLGSLVIGSSSSEFESESGTDSGQSRTPTDNSNFSMLDVIVVNDGSKDRTSEIAHEFAAKYPGVFRVIDKPNGHYGSCINAGLKVASGKYVKVLDADDSFDTEVLNRYLEFLTFAPECDAVLNDFDEVDEEGSVTREWRIPYGDGMIGIEEIVANSYELLMHGIAYRREIFSRFQYRQTERCLYTDSEWVCAPMMQVRKLLTFKHPLYKYLVGRAGQSVTIENTLRCMPDQVKVFESIIKLREDLDGRLDDVHKKFLELYLKRLYRITAPYYFLIFPLSRMRCEYLKLDKRLMKISPSSRKVGMWMSARILQSTPFEIDCYAAWQRSKCFRCFYPWLFRTYCYLRSPKAFWAVCRYGRWKVYGWK